MGGMAGRTLKGGSPGTAYLRKVECIYLFSDPIGGGEWQQTVGERFRVVVEMGGDFGFQKNHTTSLGSGDVANCNVAAFISSLPVLGSALSGTLTCHILLFFSTHITYRGHDQGWEVV